MNLHNCYCETLVTAAILVEEFPGKFGRVTRLSAGRGKHNRTWWRWEGWAAGAPRQVDRASASALACALLNLGLPVGSDWPRWCGPDEEITFYRYQGA